MEGAPSSLAHFSSALDKQSVDRCLFQGSRCGLPEYCGGDPANYFVKLDYIWKLLEQEIVVLVRGNWLLARSRTVPFEPLPCRQNLPPEAKVNVSQLKLWAATCLERGSPTPWPCIVAISHCWLHKEHPDPNGLLLRELAPVIEAYLEDFGKEKSDLFPPDFDGAFFLAWCSVHQVGHNNVTMEEMCAFQIALENMDIWYAHMQTETWMLTKVLCTERPYEKRGWPTWERAISEILSVHNGVLDLGRLSCDKIRGPKEKGGHRSALLQIMDICCIGSRRPPLVPEDFEELIADKDFTMGNVDCDQVKRNYKRNFGHVMSCVTKFDFENLGWCDSDIHLLVKVLPYCFKLEALHLRKNRITDAGAILLEECMRLNPQLKLQILDVVQNPISGDMRVRLRDLTHRHK